MTTPDQNPFPPMNICPTPFEGVRRAIQRARDLGRVTELCLSEHISEPATTGAEAMLSQAAFDFPEKKPDAGL